MKKIYVTPKSNIGWFIYRVITLRVHEVTINVIASEE